MGLIGGISPGGGIALGIIVGLISTSVQSLGLTLQRKSHILEDEKGPYDVRRPPYRRRRWQIGMGMFIISNVIGSSVQISVLPLPVLSTLQASGLVFNSICATLILGEPFTRWSLWGTLLVCGGAVLIAIFGAIPSPAHKLSELLELLGRGPFVAWMVFQAILVLGIAIATDVISNFTKLMQCSRFRLARGFAYGCISGILSAHSLLVAKSAVELLVKTLVDGENQFVHWESWAILVALVTLALSQLYYLHRGLKLVSTSVLYPLIFCVYNIIAILDGLIYFDQTELISPLQACLITLGTVILLTGVLALSWRLHDEQHTPGVGQSTLAPGMGLVEDTDAEDDEEAVLLRSDIEDEEERVGIPSPRLYSYSTFSTSQSRLQGDGTSQGGSGGPVLVTAPPKRQRSLAGQSIRTLPSNRWTERAEIWDELEDRDTPPDHSSLSSPAFLSSSRRRSTTLPVTNPNEGTSLLHPRRREVSDSHNQFAPRAATDLASPRRNFRRRRKSTGFPGFIPRKPSATTGAPRKPSGGGGLQDIVGGFLRARWWKNKPKTTLGVPSLREEAIVAARNRIHEEEEGEGLLEGYQHQPQAQAQYQGQAASGSGSGSGSGTHSERMSPKTGHRGTEGRLSLDGVQGPGPSTNTKTTGGGGIRNNGRRKVDDTPV
ncbi:hypothetical protein QBC32DRAFT_54452 [Pseudoneurospora amorphoporcata]|uniref:DUF803 domain-containing protein n=1 Tax=Pseudoneurospora amorphoporcata TaxID=241081 RepID=A0AAN6NRK9_9PEZI|nr:hypothetical protein QBC32DRAFT_54452 [Pseudoneurospora amorphoporcata]